MKRSILFTILLLVALSGWSGLRLKGEPGAWRRALPGWEYEFPRDHFAHPEFKTEWWYFTGNLRAADSGREFGYQLTFFRQGVRPPGSQEANSRFVIRDLHMAHFAISDIEAESFLCQQRVTRGAFGEAGYATDPESQTDAITKLAWNGDWRLEMEAPMSGDEAARFQLSAAQPGASLTLTLRQKNPAVFHGIDGVSQKTEETGNASHYYSITRLETSGTLRVGERKFAVEGLSWLDREWSTSVLGEDLVGWDWFALRLSNGDDLMIYQLRDRAGRAASSSSGSWIAASRKSGNLSASQFTLTPLEYWTSDESGAQYPVRWRIEIPDKALDLEVHAAFPRQELALDPVTYWEGAVEARGSLGNEPVTAAGYLEMTGYAGEVAGLR